jgi:branched-subunit amino acid aminotransferase/4-amino-4-deoxychorismate lyase
VSSRLGDTTGAAGAAGKGNAAERTPEVALRETCRVVAGRVPLWRYHRARLEAGGCGDALLAAADEVMLDAVSAWRGQAPGSSRVRLTLVANPEGSVSARVERRLSSLDVPGGPAVALVEVATPPTQPHGAAKPADRTYWHEAQRRARALGADQALLVSGEAGEAGEPGSVLDGGSVVDGGNATVWIVIDGAIVTPPAPPAVAGVARAFLLEALAGAGTPARVGPVAPALLDAADEVFLTNAFGGAVHVRGRGPGPVFDRVARIFAAMWGA